MQLHRVTHDVVKGVVARGRLAVAERSEAFLEMPDEVEAVLKLVARLCAFPHLLHGRDRLWRDVLKILAPLGLFENRFRAVVAISERFLGMDEFHVSLDKEFKIYGIGEFGVDSFNIFCRGGGASMAPSDRNLAAFCRWLKDTQGPASAKAEPE